MKHLSNEELINGARICISLIQEYLKGQTFDSLEENFQVYDAVSYRMIVLGKLISNVSEDLKNRYPDFHWFISCFQHDEPIEVAWDLYEANETNAGYCESFKSIDEELFRIYNQEWNHQNQRVKKKEIDVNLLTEVLAPKNPKWDNRFDNLYGIKTSNSIWTVRKK